METVPLDIAPQQVVRWLRDERRVGALPVDMRATRSYVAQESKPRIDDIGGDAAEPLGVITAVGLLEVTPRTDRDGWALSIRVEDDIGARLPEDDSAPEGEEEIDLDTFNADFIVPDRGTAFVSVDVEDAASMARFEELFESMLTNIHPK